MDAKNRLINTDTLGLLISFYLGLPKSTFE